MVGDDDSLGLSGFRRPGSTPARRVNNVLPNVLNVTQSPSRDRYPHCDRTPCTRG
ncbi:hypothetical protein J6590_040630 [Homalodisca vitripennis]|nr:hypothetical protein J6590_040630 [Homalodisca vitripennis]